jgi:hypothetical protein
MTSRHLCIGLTGALLTACGRSAAGVDDLPARQAIDAAHHSRTFEYTGAEQKFKVPAGVTSISVDATGAAGAGALGGRGGRTRGVITVRAGETLALFVGGAGSGSSGSPGGGLMEVPMAAPRVPDTTDTAAAAPRTFARAAIS